VSGIKNVVVVDVDEDVDSVIIHHPSGDEEVIVLGPHTIRSDDDDIDDEADDQS